MRYGVISDVHGNLPALEATLAALDRAGIDRIVCAGDLVGYGPRPNECVARIAALDPAPLVVAGNHDLMAVGRLPAGSLGPLPRQTLEWTREVLEGDARRYLEGLPTIAATPDGATLAHGSLADPTEYVLDCTAAREQLRLLEQHSPAARVLILGHTHQPLACTPRAALDARGDVELSATDGPWLLNAGSVGQSRERRALARALVLDTAAGRARFLELDYDVHAVKRQLREAGLPEHACHVEPGRRARLRRLLVRL
jgi:predicted phosphodiesterase